MMDIGIDAKVSISAEKLVEGMTGADIAELLNAVALKLDGKFRDRSLCAEAFANNTTEIGSRFLAEIVAHRFKR